MKDLIIAATANYGKKELYNYVESINMCGFTGDKIMIVYNTDGDTISFLKENGWEVYQSQLQGHVHMHRLITIYSVLTHLNRNYRYLITTDVRDVIFQKNPSEYLESNLKKKLLVSSENVLYRDEAWGRKNILEGYNEILWKRYQDNLTCNVGVLAGEYKSMKDLLLLNYLVSQSGDTNHFTDQSSFNFIIHNELVKDDIQMEGLETNWALQMGTLNNAKLIGVQKHNIDDYVIIHQYDRYPEVTKKIIERITK